MNVKGHIHPIVISLMRNHRWSMLDRKKMYKTIYKERLFSKKGHGSVEVLYLAPKASVKKHQHISDSEIYLYWDDSEQCFKHETCNVGEWHRLKNTSDKNWAIVLSVKFASKNVVEEQA